MKWKEVAARTRKTAKKKQTKSVRSCSNNLNYQTGSEPRSKQNLNASF